jgi:hypothetical protein
MLEAFHFVHRQQRQPHYAGRVDGMTVLDQWEECCSTFISDLVTIGEGYHI